MKPNSHCTWIWLLAASLSLMTLSKLTGLCILLTCMEGQQLTFGKTFSLITWKFAPLHGYNPEQNKVKIIQGSRSQRARSYLKVSNITVQNIVFLYDFFSDFLWERSPFTLKLCEVVGATGFQYGRYTWKRHSRIVWNWKVLRTFS